MALARFISGLIFPVYLGCGFYRISFARFAATTALTAAIYLPIVLYLIIRFGEPVLANLGYWSWLLLIAFLAIAAMNWIRHPHWKFLLRVSVAGARARNGDAGRRRARIRWPNQPSRDARHRPVVDPDRPG